MEVRDEYQGYPPWPYGGCALHGELGRLAAIEQPRPGDARPPSPSLPSSAAVVLDAIPTPLVGFPPPIKVQYRAAHPPRGTGRAARRAHEHHVYVALGGAREHWMMGLPHVALTEARRDGAPQQRQHVVREEARDFLLLPIVIVSVVAAREDGAGVPTVIAGAAAVLARRLQHRLAQGGVTTKHVEHDPVLGCEEDPGRRRRGRGGRSVVIVVARWGGRTVAFLPGSLLSPTTAAGGSGGTPLPSLDGRRAARAPPHRARASLAVSDAPAPPHEIAGDAGTPPPPPTPPTMTTTSFPSTPSPKSIPLTPPLEMTDDNDDDDDDDNDSDSDSNSDSNSDDDEDDDDEDEEGRRRRRSQA